MGSFYFIIPPILSFLFVTNEMLREKEKKQREYLQIMGIECKVYWSSWLITIIMMSIVQSVLMTVSGYLFGFDLFVQSPVGLMVFLFFSLCLSMLLLGMLVVVLCPNQKVGNTIVYAILLFSWVLQLLLSNKLFQYALYQQPVHHWIILFRSCLSFYPPYHFSKIWTDISQYAGIHWDLNDNRWVEGQGYYYSYLFQNQSGFVLDKYFSTPTTFANISFIYLDLIIIFLLFLYFDNLFLHNKPNIQKWWFIFDVRILIHFFQHYLPVSL